MDKAAPLKRCVYCGAPCRGRVCHAHSDLLKLDQVERYRFLLEQGTAA